jgi:hypothetical protein
MGTTRVLQPISIYRQEAKEGMIWDRAPGEESSMSGVLAGAPLVRDASTKELEEWAGGTDASLIVGFAAHALSGTAGTKVGYWEANDYNLFEASLINATAAYTLLGTEVGMTYSLIKASNANWYVDVADTATDIVVVVGLISAVGDTNPRVIVRVVTGKQANVPVP